MKKVNPGMFSSKSDEWETPQWLFDELNKYFDFTLDVAASTDNAKVDRCYTKANSAFDHSWAGERCFMNPPYGREIKNWTSKAVLETTHNDSLVVCLLPGRVDTYWFSDSAPFARAIVLLKGRLKFGNSSPEDAALSSAPFPSMLCIFAGGTEDHLDRINKFLEGFCKNKLSVYM